MTLDLSQYPTSVLETIAREAREKYKRHPDANQPVTRQEFASWKVGAAADSLWKHLQNIPLSAWAPLISAVLAERKAMTRPRPELVWTGSTTTRQPRDTAVVVNELMSTAQTHLLISIYSWSGGQHLIATLREAQARGVVVDVYLQINQEANQPLVTETKLTQEIGKFLNAWGDGPRPNIFYDRRVLEGALYISMHAKCIVVDRTTCFIGSANFTDRGHTRNIEAGVILRDIDFTQNVLAEFNAGPFVRWYE